jgi:hypothetical protein
MRSKYEICGGRADVVQKSKPDDLQNTADYRMKILHGVALKGP